MKRSDWGIYICNVVRKPGTEPLRGWDWRRTKHIKATDVEVVREIGRAPTITFSTDREYDAPLKVGDHVVVTRNGDDYVNGVITNNNTTTSDALKTYQASGVTSKLSRVRMPRVFTLRGIMNSVHNKARLMSRYVYRRTTSASPAANSNWDGRGVLSWAGKTSANGGVGVENAILTNTIIWTQNESDYADGSGALSTEGGSLQAGVPQPPFQASGTYASPRIDIRSPEGISTQLDELRVSYSPNSNVAFRIATANTDSVSGRTFSGDPTGISNDVSPLRAYPAAKYIYVELTINNGTESSKTPALVTSFDVVSRHIIRGITAGVVPPIAIGDMDVGGQTLWDTLQDICRQHQLEFWEGAGGILNVAIAPLPGAGWSPADDVSDVVSLVEGTHCEINRLAPDYRAVSNLVHVVGPGETHSANFVSRQDDASISKYGIHERTINITNNDSARSFDDIVDMADDVIQRAAEPRYTANVSVETLPVGAPHIAIGKVIRLQSTRRGPNGSPIDIKARVISETRNIDLSNMSESLAVEVETAPRIQD